MLRRICQRSVPTPEIVWWTSVLLLLQDLALCCLRVSKVHHLIQQFIDDDKVVPDTLLLQHLEVFGKHLHNLVEEQKDLGGIRVSFGQCEDVEVAVTDVEVLDTRIIRVSGLQHADRRSGSGSGSHDEVLEHTLTPSWEKQGGTAELSSSASLRRTRKFSTADMGMSPR